MRGNCRSRMSLRSSRLRLLDATFAKKKPGARPAFHFQMDARVKPGHDERRAPHNTRLLSFTFSASRYTLEPISLNFALICFMPSSAVPLIDMPIEFGSFSVAA